jgi:tetratricopeptide (TPR) repeat protein
MAFRIASFGNEESNYLPCCHMLGVCFRQKGIYKVALMWFERGLRLTTGTEDQYQALRFEIGECYEGMGETAKALDLFMEVYGVDVNYRKVGEKIKRLQALSPA